MHRDLSLAAILIVRLRDREGGSGLDEADRSAERAFTALEPMSEPVLS
jgi:hypothetical protein